LWEKGVTLVLLRVVGAAPEQKLACRNDVKYHSYTLVKSLLDCMTFVNWHSTDYKGYCLWGYDSVLKKSKRFSNPITGLDRPRGFQEVKAPRFQDNRHMKVVRLSPYELAAFTPRKYS